MRPVPKDVIYEPAKETAKKIRAALKERFPGVKFSVRSLVFSGGDSVDVHWVDGPMEEEVNEILRKFQSGGYDGMQDMYVYNSYEYEGKIYCGAKYVSGSRDLSPEYKAKIAAKAKEIFGDDYDPNGWDFRKYRMDKEAEKELKEEEKAKRDRESEEKIVKEDEERFGAGFVF